jgi:hypothetical protein
LLPPKPEIRPWLAASQAITLPTPCKPIQNPRSTPTQDTEDPFRYSLDEKNNPLGGLSIKSQSFKLLYVTKVQTGDVKPVFDMGSFSE